MKQRLSNIELLRIISMIMVLALHVNFFTLGAPSLYEIQTNCFGAVSRVFFEFLCIVAVNVFVFISGWFGIKAKKKGLLRFLFQILFFYVGIYIVFVLSGKQKLSWDGVQCCFLLKKTGWFIKSYLCLYLLTPVLNVFVEKADKKLFARVLVAFFVFELVYGWLFKDAAKFFELGYSTISFVGLYLLARFVRLYGKSCSLFVLPKFCDLAIFLAICVSQTLVFVVLRYYGLAFINNLWAYSSPFVIVSALYLLLFFSKIEFSSKVVNIIASSSFAAYLLHSFFCIIPFYQAKARQIFYSYDGVVCLFYMVVLILVVYFVAIAIDKIRMVCWKQIEEKL